MGTTLSPDGRWMWDGAQWTPVPVAVTETRPGARSTLAIAGGVVGIAGAAILLVSYIVPYATWAATEDYDAGSYSTFGIGPWVVVTTVAALAAGLAASISLLVVTNRIAIAVAAGALLAFGIQSFTDWAGIEGMTISYDEQLAWGSFLGIAGSLVLFLGGLLAMISLIARRGS